jgi:hypothetical protein
MLAYVSLQCVGTGAFFNDDETYCRKVLRQYSTVALYSPQNKKLFHTINSYGGKKSKKSAACKLPV